jgi:nucleoside-diphosphate-sugar epimerase
MKLLLTGASGFIGSEVKRAYSKGLVCVTRDKFATNTNDLLYIDGINSQTDWSQIQAKGITHIIHLAGLAHSSNHSDADYNEVNVNGTIKLARDAARYGVKRFVFVSSIGVHGTNSGAKPFNVDDLDLNPQSAYAKSKLAAEAGLQKIAQQTGIELVIIRPTLVYGPNAPGNFGMLTKFVNSFPIQPFGLVSNKRHFISVQNLADLLLVCVEHPKANGRVYLAAEEYSISTAQFIDQIAKGLDKKMIQLPVPPLCIKIVLYLFGKKRLYNQMYGNLEVDTTCLSNGINWHPRYTVAESMILLNKNNSN